MHRIIVVLLARIAVDATYRSGAQWGSCFDNTCRVKRGWLNGICCGIAPVLAALCGSARQYRLAACINRRPAAPEKRISLAKWQIVMN
jgi:hypothetical protein